MSKYCSICSSFNGCDNPDHKKKKFTIADDYSQKKSNMESRDEGSPGAPLGFPCPRCKKKELTYKIVYPSSADQATMFNYTCRACGAKYLNLEFDSNQEV